MVGIEVGGKNSGLDVGCAVAVGLGMGVNVAVAFAVAVGDGKGVGVGVMACPHALNNKPMTRKTMICKEFFMLAHFHR